MRGMIKRTDVAREKLARRWHALLRTGKYSCRTAAGELGTPLTTLIAWEKKFMLKRPL